MKFFFLAVAEFEVIDDKVRLKRPSFLLIKRRDFQLSADKYFLSFLDVIENEIAHPSPSGYFDEIGLILSLLTGKPEFTHFVNRVILPDFPQLRVGYKPPDCSPFQHRRFPPF